MLIKTQVSINAQIIMPDIFFNVNKNDLEQRGFYFNN